MSHDNDYSTNDYEDHGVAGMDGIMAYIDFIWLPVTWFAVHHHQHLKSMLFVLACLLTLRTQVEVMEAFGHPDGFLPFAHGSAQLRGMIVYSFFILIFLILAHFSPRRDGMLLFAACLSAYIMAFCASMLVMAL